MADDGSAAKDKPGEPQALKVSLKRTFLFGFGSAALLSLFAVPAFLANDGMTARFVLAVWRQVTLFGLLTIPLCALIYLSRLGPRDSTAGNDAAFFGVIAAFSLIALATPGLDGASAMLVWLWVALGGLCLTNAVPAVLGQGWLVLALRNRPNDPPVRIDAKAVLAVVLVAVAFMGAGVFFGKFVNIWFDSISWTGEPTPPPRGERTGHESALIILLICLHSILARSFLKSGIMVRTALYAACSFAALGVYWTFSPIDPAWLFPACIAAGVLVHAFLIRFPATRQEEGRS